MEDTKEAGMERLEARLRDEARRRLVSMQKHIRTVAEGDATQLMYDKTGSQDGWRALLDSVFGPDTHSRAEAAKHLRSLIYEDVCKRAMGEVEK